jgi:hypothetical protein
MSITTLRRGDWASIASSVVIAGDHSKTSPSW